MGVVLYRFAQKDLKDWFYGSHRKPLVLRGARQVGKSTLVRLAARELGLRLFEINLERHLYLNDVFKTQDMGKIMAEIQGIVGTIARPEKSLLFLDEIQAVPQAIQSLRYFLEDMPELAVISAGSLLEFTLADHNFSMPVGRITYYHLGPLSFLEYLRACDEDLYTYLESYTPDQEIPDSRHGKLLEAQRTFLFTGGMPEAVALWQEKGSFEGVRDIQREIVDTYMDDFAKYAKKEELARLQMVFRSLPGLAGKKVKYSFISPEAKAAVIKSSLDLLGKAKICYPVYHSDCSGLPLGAGINDKVFKLIFIDTGLMNCLLGLDWNHIRNLDEKTLVNEGALAEQFAGQELLASGKARPELFYWLREGKGNKAEVDYIISSGADIIPLEIKAGKSGTLKSLHQFAYAKKAGTAIRFDLNKPSTQTVITKVSDSHNNFHEVSFKLISLPLYMAGKVRAFL